MMKKDIGLLISQWIHIFGSVLSHGSWIFVIFSKFQNDIGTHLFHGGKKKDVRHCLATCKFVPNYKCLIYWMGNLFHPVNKKKYNLTHVT